MSGGNDRVSYISNNEIEVGKRQDIQLSFSDDIQAQKRTIREKLIARQSAISRDIHRSVSRQIVARLISLPEVSNARTVHLFLPVISDCEPDIGGLLSFFFTHSIHVVSPVVEAFGRNAKGTYRLSHRAVLPETLLVTNRWGIREPVRSTEVRAENWDVILVPALGMDYQGNRIGHGYGYYDELLKDLDIPVIVPILSDFLLSTIPHTESDVRIPTIVTENTILRPDVT